MLLRQTRGWPKQEQECLTSQTTGRAAGWVLRLEGLWGFPPASLAKWRGWRVAGLRVGLSPTSTIDQMDQCVCECADGRAQGHINVPRCADHKNHD